MLLDETSAAQLTVTNLQIKKFGFKKIISFIFHLWAEASIDMQS